MKENIKYKKVFIVLIGYELSIINYFSYLFLIFRYLFIFVFVFRIALKSLFYYFSF